MPRIRLLLAVFAAVLVFAPAAEGAFSVVMRACPPAAEEELTTIPLRTGGQLLLDYDGALLTCKPIRTARGKRVRLTKLGPLDGSSKVATELKVAWTVSDDNEPGRDRIWAADPKTGRVILKGVPAAPATAAGEKSGPAGVVRLVTAGDVVAWVTGTGEVFAATLLAPAKVTTKNLPATLPTLGRFTKVGAWPDVDVSIIANTLIAIEGGYGHCANAVIGHLVFGLSPTSTFADETSPNVDWVFPCHKG